jgi:hypothetical protein
MSVMKDFDRRIRQGGDDAIAVVSEYTSGVEGWLKSFAALAKHVIPCWIPVSERLPDERVKVLTCGDDPVEGPFTLIGLREPASIFGPAHWHLPGFSEFGPVTHWQPLPSPPEVE